MDKEISSLDYKTMSLENLVDRFTTLLNQAEITSIKEEAHLIRAIFYQKYNEGVENAKKAFLETGGNEIDFNFSSPVQIEFKRLWKLFMDKKKAHHQQVTNNLNDNLEKKEGIIKAIKKLIEEGEVATNFKEFKQLQADWKEIGAIPSEKYQETWGNYQLYVEQFYDLLHLNNDLRTIDFKHNLEAKQQIIAKAKELLQHADTTFAFNELQVLHKLWKEETGPVAKEYREPVWQEFSEITTAIHKRKTAFFEQLKKEEEQNYVLKLAKIKELENFDVSKNHTFGDWKKSIAAYDKLKEEFLAIGKIPKNKTQQVWEQFKNTTKVFNTAKNDFFKAAKQEQNQALAQKKALIKEALFWKDSEDITKATDAFKRIQAAWKNVGFVPRKQADALWKEFKAICDAYFEKLHAIKKEGTQEQKESLNSKIKFLEVIASGDITVENVGEILSTWIQIGTVPPQKNKIDQDIQTQITNSIVLPADKEVATFITYQIKVAYWAAIESKKLAEEFSLLKKEVEGIHRDLKQLENNLGFVSGGKKDNPLLQIAMQSLQQEKKKLKVAKQKLHFVKSLL